MEKYKQGLNTWHPGWIETQSSTTHSIAAWIEIWGAHWAQNRQVTFEAMGITQKDWNVLQEK